MNIKFDVKEPKNQTKILIGLVAVLIVILYLNFILIPQIARVFKVAVKNNKAKAEIRDIKNEIANIDKYKTEIAAYKDKVELYERMLPAEQEVPNLLESLSTIARTSGVKIVGITPVAVSQEKQNKAQIYQEIPILISARSGYHELGNFLTRLEESDRFMKVADIEIRANRTAPRKHDAELLVLTYILLKAKK